MTQLSPAANGGRASEDRQVTQVFYSKGARRGWALLTVLVFLGCLIAVAVQWARVQTTVPLTTTASYNNSVDYPRQIADAMLQCAKTNGQYGDNGTLQVPVIGSGVFQRVIHVVPDGTVMYAVDPFTGQVIRPLTALEAHATRTCRYAVEQYGVVPPHTVILTYDDGPSAQWTPQLLGILQAYGVNATFFNIGSYIMASPQVFKAVLAHGNSIGNHTLNHPELYKVSSTTARSELVADARVMAGVANYQTRIWRTPYGGGDAVSIGDNMFATLVGQQLGFTEVGFTENTADYAANGKEIPPPKLPPGSNTPGTLVIMHDGGGDRAGTLLLTKQLIREARGLGYKFMTVPQLLAEQPGWSGPVTSRIQPAPPDYAAYWLLESGTVFKQVYQNFIRYMTVIIMVISGLVLVGAAFDRWLSYRRPPEWHPQELGVLIPCWKESKVIRSTVERVLDAGAGLPFPLRVVLVDDGSADKDPTDTTWEILCQLADEYPEVEAVHQHNGGKARALNYGLQFITSELVVVMDADTIPRDTKSFSHLVRWFKDPRVGSVAGWTKAGDRGKGWRQHMIAEFQSAEYDLGIALIRSVQNLTNSIVIVPGAFAAFRTEWLREVGYLPDRVVAEDAEAPQRMRRVRPRMRILQDLTACAYTEVPLTFAVLRKQWRRWTIGVLQTLWEHREIFYRMDKYQLLTLQWWFALYGNVVPSLFLPLSYAMLIYGLTNGTIGGVYWYPLIFIIFRAAQTLVAMIILRSWMNPFVALWYRFINDPLQIYLTIVCYWMILTGRMPTNRKIWTQVPRTGVIVGGNGTRKVAVGARSVASEVPGAVSAAPALVPNQAPALVAAEAPALVPDEGPARTASEAQDLVASEAPGPVSEEPGADGEEPSREVQLSERG